MPFSFESLAADLEMFEMRSPLAPGLHVAFGRWKGALHPISALSTGKGRDAKLARLGCLGEAVENLSIGPAAHPQPVWTATPAGPVDARAGNLDCPDDLGSEGCAAHVDPELARKGAVLERIERAALAMWWRSEAALTEVALDPVLLAHYRQGETRRWSRCWQIGAFPGIATCLAITGDAQGGPMVMGSAAADSPAIACEAALAEALLSEVALLAPPQHPDNRRALAMHAKLAPRLAPESRGGRAPAGPPLGAAELVALCRRAGHDIEVTDLTHPALGIPVWRAVSVSLPRWRPILLTSFDV